MIELCGPGYNGVNLCGFDPYSRMYFENRPPCERRSFRCISGLTRLRSYQRTQTYLRKKPELGEPVINTSMCFLDRSGQFPFSLYVKADSLNDELLLAWRYEKARVALQIAYNGERSGASSLLFSAPGKKPIILDESNGMYDPKTKSKFVASNGICFLEEFDPSINLFVFDLATQRKLIRAFIPAQIEPWLTESVRKQLEMQNRVPVNIFEILDHLGVFIDESELR